MPSKYAERTEVPASRSVAEIGDMLRRHGAQQFVSGWDDARHLAVVEFVLIGRRIRFLLPMPDRKEKRFTHQPNRTWQERSATAATAAYEQAIRQRWRALLLILRAKLEAVESGIVTVETEFMAQTVLPSGRTVAEEAGPAIAVALERGTMPELLPGLGDR